MAVDSLSRAADIMLDHPITLQLRTLQTLAEVATDKNSTVVFPAPLMTTINELGTFLAGENKPRSATTTEAMPSLRVDEA
jgi:hypothetical protein